MAPGPGPRFRPKPRACLTTGMRHTKLSRDPIRPLQGGTSSRYRTQAGEATNLDELMRDVGGMPQLGRRAGFSAGSRKIPAACSEWRGEDSVRSLGRAGDPVFAGTGKDDPLTRSRSYRAHPGRGRSALAPAPLSLAVEVALVSLGKPLVAVWQLRRFVGRQSRGAICSRTARWPSRREPRQPVPSLTWY